MVRVDEGRLDLDQVEDHFVRGCQAVVEDTLHDVVHARLQLVIACQFGQLNFEDQPSELLVDKRRAVETWLEETSDLLANQHFESAFRNEKTWAHS